MAGAEVMQSPDLLKHILWSCMDEDDAEMLWASGFHAVSWTHYAAFLAHARKRIDGATLGRYDRDTDTLVGPGGRRGNPWALGMVGGITSVALCRGADHISSLLTHGPDEMLASVNSINLGGTESVYHTALDKTSFGVAKRCCARTRGAAALVVADSTNQNKFLEMYAHNPATVPCIDCFSGVREAELRSACSAAHVLGIMALLPRVRKLTLVPDEDFAWTVQTIDVASSWKRIFKDYMLSLETCFGVEELVLDGNGGIVAQMLRDLCFDWELEKRRRRLYGHQNIVYTDEALSYCPAFPMRNVTRVVIRGPVWWQYSRNVLMPGVREVEFQSLPFTSQLDALKSIGAPAAQMCYACFPNAERIVLRVDERDVALMDHAIVRYNSDTEAAEHRDDFAILLRMYRNCRRALDVVVDCNINDWVRLYPNPDLGDTDDVLRLGGDAARDASTDDMRAAGDASQADDTVFLTRDGRCCGEGRVRVLCAGFESEAWHVMCLPCTLARLFGCWC